MKTILHSQRLALRPLALEDGPAYYKAGFAAPDPEVTHYTGATDTFSKEEILAYVEKIVTDDSRRDFLILHQEKIIGEIVLLEIQWESKICHLRMALFSQEHFGQGFGGEALERVLAYAFEDLSLHRIELEVFDFNPRAARLYRSAGFTLEGRLRDAHWQGGRYHDILVMAMLAPEWKKRRENNL